MDFPGFSGQQRLGAAGLSLLPSCPELPATHLAELLQLLLEAVVLGLQLIILLLQGQLLLLTLPNYFILLF